MSTFTYQFDLEGLGLARFQDVCVNILRESGWEVDEFLGVYDGGQGGAFRARRRRAADEAALAGVFLVQWKYMHQARPPLRLSHLTDELRAAKAFVQRDLCDSYGFMTNARLHGRARAQLTAWFAELGVHEFHVLDRHWIERTLRECETLRADIPQFYGLRELSSVLPR